MYGTQRIFTFTFEMYPRRTSRAARFYPPDELIARETRRNREAVLYLMEQADCPYRALGRRRGVLRAVLRRPRDRPRLDGRPRWHRHRDAGAWQRGDPVAGRLAARLGGLRPLRPGHGRPPGVDVDGGRTTIRSRSVHLPSGRAATLRLRYWVGHVHRRHRRATGSGSAGRPSDGHVLACALTALTGRGRVHGGRRGAPARSPSRHAARRGRRRASCTPSTPGADATVEAGVDDVRITVAGP